MINLTLTADEDQVAKARAYAHAHGTTLNQLIRDFLRRLTGQLDRQKAAEEFAELARHQAGRSDEGFVFRRDAVHERNREVLP